MKVSADFRNMIASLGPEMEGLIDALETTPPSVSVRVNPSRPKDFSDCEQVPWCPEGYYLESRPKFTLDPALHQGRYYVQDASSMFVSYVIRTLTAGIHRPLRVLDACAAPGGKTTAAIDALPPGSLVVANEIVPARAATLRENIIKWGNPNVIVTRADTAQFRKLDEEFDIIIIDAPCSGEGMMRKDEKAVEQWTPALVKECAERQERIVDNLWGALAPGGFMIYSTCTFNVEENEQIAAYIGSYFGSIIPPQLPIDSSWGILPALVSNIPCYRFLPGRVRGEGLFLSVLFKSGEQKPKKVVEKKVRNQNKEIAQYGRWLKSAEEFTLKEVADRLVAFPKMHEEILRKVEKVADVIYSGVGVAERAGRDYAPAHSLAMSTALADKAFPTVELSRDDALEYLRRHAITLPEGAPRGYVMVTYDGYPLGFVKNLGNRANNLYPRDWRIMTL